MIKKEIEWAGHLGLNSVIFTNPIEDLVNFGRILNWSLEFLRYTNVFVRISVKDWDNWNLIRNLCGHSHKLGVILQIESGLDENELERWIAEPIRCLAFNPQTFLKNKHGFPVLPKFLQQFTFRYIKVIKN